MTQPHFFRLEKLLASRGSPLQALSPSKMKICQLSIFPHKLSFVRRILRYNLSSILHPCFISAIKKLHLSSFSKQPPFCCRPVQFAAVCTFSLFYFTPPFHCRPVQFAANPKVSAALAAAATMNTTAITGNDFEI